MTTTKKQLKRGVTITPVYFRWKRFEDSRWQLAKKVPRPIRKMGRMNREPIVLEGLYTTEQLGHVYDILIDVRNILSQRAEEHPDLMTAFQLIEDRMV